MLFCHSIIYGTIKAYYIFQNQHFIKAFVRQILLDSGQLSWATAEDLATH